MEVFARLLYLGFGLLANMAGRLKELISTSKDDEDLNSLDKMVRTTFQTAATKLYFNYRFLIILEGYPYQDGNIENWFTKEIPLPKDPSINRQINMLNMRKIQNFERKCPLIYGRGLEIHLQEENGFEIFYHGTDHGSAKDIIENGIRLDKLRSRGQDFSCGKGFYLTNKFDTNTGAAQWACNRCSKNDPCILIFKIPKDEIEEYRKNAKNLFDNQGRLEEIIKRYRVEKGKFVDKETLKEDFGDVSFVEGPWVKLKKNLDGEETFDSSIVGSYQICLHSKDVRDCFNRYLDCAIFFDTSSTS